VKPAFRLASVLRLRRTLEEQSAVRAATAHRAAGAAAEVARARHDDLRRFTLVPGDASTFAASLTARTQRTQAARSASSAAADAEALHRTRVAELVHAAMQVSVLERLEERNTEAAREAERVREAREVDDLVTVRFARRGGTRR
jgi:hypothetical protein